MKKNICVFSQATDLREGLFGNVFYHIFMILPYLYKRGIFPAWEIRSIHYGAEPDFITIPGALDISYTVPQGPYCRISLMSFVAGTHRSLAMTGQNSAAFGMLISQFRRAFSCQPTRSFPWSVLGLHYRGTDKLTSVADSNPISQQDFLTLVREFLATAPPFDVIFAATDEISFVERLRATVDLPVINLGEVDFHKAIKPTTSPKEKTDCALLDCVLLSRCSCLIETSSALPSFTKILNPDIEIYRTAASKLFRPNMPYFPVAFIPILPVSSPESRAILDTTLVSDWTLDSNAKRFEKKFAFSTYRPLHHSLFTIAEKLGASEMITVHR